MSDLNWMFLITALMSYAFAGEILSKSRHNQGSLDARDGIYLIIGLLAGLEFADHVTPESRSAIALILYGGYAALIVSPVLAAVLYTPGILPRVLRVIGAVAMYTSAYVVLTLHCGWSDPAARIPAASAAFLALGPVRALWQWGMTLHKRHIARRRQDAADLAAKQEQAQRHQEKAAEKEAFEQLVRDLGK